MAKASLSARQNRANNQNGADDRVGIQADPVIESSALRYRHGS